MSETRTSKMIAPYLSQDSIAAMIRFFKENIPGDGNGGWDHMFTTAYGIGCEALAALGQAVEKSRGAVPRDDPALPEILPGTDDLCVAVLYLANQQGLTNYLSERPPRPSGEWRDSRFGDRPTPPNIHTASDLDAAWADEHFHMLLGQLGLIEDSVWTEWAEPILWRSKPDGWGAIMDAELVEAVERAAIAQANFIDLAPSLPMWACWLWRYDRRHFKHPRHPTVVPFGSYSRSKHSRRDSRSGKKATTITRILNGAAT